MDTVLETRDLTKRYGLAPSRSVTALKGVTLTLERGHIYGLVGNNGSGKTTFMRTVTGLTAPTSGSISLFGAGSGTALSQARRRVGALVESPAYYPDLTLMQNLRAQNMLLERAQRADLQALCALVGLAPGDIGRRRIKNCSQGQRQRYGIAAALLGQPELVLLDEPFNGLDPSGVQELRALLLRLNQERGLTLLVSSHILTELHKVATDYIFFDMGEVVETISAQELDRRVQERKLKDTEAYFLELVRRKLSW